MPKTTRIMFPLAVFCDGLRCGAYGSFAYAYHNITGAVVYVVAVPMSLGARWAAREMVVQQVAYCIVLPIVVLLGESRWSRSVRFWGWLWHT